MRSIREAPAHLLLTDDVDNCCSLLSLCFFNAWDFTLISRDQRLAIRGSHDEYIQVTASEAEDLNSFKEHMLRLGLTECQPAVHRDRSFNELTALDGLRNSLKSEPANADTRRRLAKQLYDLVIDAGDKSPGFLEELRLLARANPLDTFVREHLAKALGAAIFYAGEEKSLQLISH